MASSSEHELVERTVREATLELVQKVVGPDLKASEAVVLWGYLIDNPDKDLHRLYLTPDFSEYAEFAKGDYIHHMPLSTDQHSHGGAIVWVKKGAQLVHAVIESAQAEAGFLQGDMTRNFLAQSMMGELPGYPRQLQPPTISPRIPSYGDILLIIVSHLITANRAISGVPTRPRHCH